MDLTIPYQIADVTVKAGVGLTALYLIHQLSRSISTLAYVVASQQGTKAQAVFEQMQRLQQADNHKPSPLERPKASVHIPSILQPFDDE